MFVRHLRFPPPPSLGTCYFVGFDAAHRVPTEISCLKVRLFGYAPESVQSSESLPPTVFRKGPLGRPQASTASFSVIVPTAPSGLRVPGNGSESPSSLMLG
jgi:hypothetical protein